MPQVALGAAIGAGISTGLAAAGAFGMTLGTMSVGSFFMASFARSFVLGAVMQALQDKPDFNANDQGITLTNRSSTATRKLIYGKRRVGGTIVAIGTEDEKNENGDVVKANQFLHMVIAVAGHRIDGIENVYFNEEVVSEDAKTFTDENAEYTLALKADTNYSDGNILIKALPGGLNQTVPAELISGFPDDYTSAHQLNETAYLYVRMKYDQEIFASGIPNITATIRGKPVNDPRDGSYAYSNNAALCIADYLIETNYGLGVAIPELDLQSFIDAANVCDEAVALEAGGTEPRYTVNGVIDSAVEPRQNIENMLTSMNGKLVYTKGLFQIFPGVYRTPNETITMDDLIDSVSISTKTSTRQLFNGVKGTFADPTQNYTLTEYPSVESSTYQAIDGYTSFQTLDLPFTTSNATAQRLAKLALNRSRQETVISMQCNLSAIDIVPGDFIYVTNEELGFNQKVFEVVSSGLAINGDGTLGVSLSAQEANASIYDWQASDEQAIITADTIYRRTYAIQAPTNLNVTSTAIVNADGTVQSKVNISFNGSVTRNVQYYELQWKLTSDDSYNSVSIGNRTEVEFTGGVIPGQNYDIRVRAITPNGAQSAFAATTHVMAGDTTAPSAPTGLSAVGRQGAVLLDWTGNTEDDLKGYYVYQHTANQFSNATQIAFVSADQFFVANLDDNDTFYFWVSAIDFTGNESAQSSVAVATTLPEPTDGTSILVVYADDAGGSNQSLTVGSRQFVQYVEYVGTPPSLPVSGTFVQFAGTEGDPGQSIFPIYATSSGGANQSFDSTGRDFVTFFEATSQPSLPVSGQTFVKFIGEDGTDGDPGDTGPRNATGYVFYEDQLASDDAPSTPNASSFNFSNGTFSGLSNKWDERVSTQTPVAGLNYWASRFSVSESTFGGAQSIDFTSPFVWQNFDGLVTFTNFQNGFDENITTIDGGNVDLVNLNADNITTGTLSSNIVYTGVLNLDDSEVGAGKTFFDPQWSTLTAAFSLESSNNSNGLYSEWDGNFGSAIYGRASDSNNNGAAVAGVNNSNPGSDAAWGGFFQCTSSGDYTRGCLGAVNSTGGSASGVDGRAPLGGVGIRCSQGRMVLGKAASEGAELEMSATSGPSWVIDVDGANFWRVFYNVAPFRQMYLRPDNGNLVLSHGTFVPFTGSHNALLNQDQDIELGDIAVDTDRIYKSDVSQTTTFVATSSKANDKRAIGVFSSQPIELTRPKDSETVETTNFVGETVTYESKPVRENALSTIADDVVHDLCDEGARLTTINSVGEGQINVCGQNGDIEAGDLIVTSDMAGKGMKQDDDLVRGYTVAKARESVTFASADEVKQIACIYLCG